MRISFLPKGSPLTSCNSRSMSTSMTMALSMSTTMSAPAWRSYYANSVPATGGGVLPSKMNISVTLIHFTFNSDIKFLTYFVLIMHANLLSRRAVRMKSIRLNQQSACLETYHMQVSPLSVRFILIPCMAAWRPHILSADLWTPRGLLHWPTRPENRPPSRHSVHFDGYAQPEIYGLINQSFVLVHCQLPAAGLPACQLPQLPHTALRRNGSN